MIASQVMSKAHAVLLIAAVGTVFVLDLWIARGVGIAMVYATFVLLAGWWADRRWALTVAGGCTLLIAVALPLLRGGHVAWSVIITNHLLALATIWITAAVVWHHKQREEKVRRLTGLLPMCSLCKKVRDDRGLWSQVEQYFEEHYADLQFTHGLCPICSKQLYPELFPKLSEQYPEVYK